jgi:integrase
MIAQNLTFLERLRVDSRRAGCKESTIKREERLFTLLLDTSRKSIEKMSDEDWNVQLDRYLTKATTHNGMILVANKIRALAGKPKLPRKFLELKAKPKLDLRKADADYEKLANAIDNDRDRVIVSIMRYGGLRASEVASLRAQSFDAHDDHVTVRFYREKTNVQSEVELVEPAADIGRFLAHVGGKGDDPVFLSRVGEPLTYWGLYKVVKRWCQVAGVKFHPHLFRHYRATELGKNNFTKWDLDNMFGWSNKGNTASIYVNLSNDETMQKIRALGGLAVQEATAPVAIRCKRCATIVPKESRWCPRCGLTTNPVDALASIQKQQAREDRIEKLSVEEIITHMHDLEMKIAELQKNKK